MPAFSDAAGHLWASVCKPPRKEPAGVGLVGAAPYGDLGKMDRPGEPILRFVMGWYPPLVPHAWACWPVWPLVRHPARGRAGQSRRAGASPTLGRRCGRHTFRPGRRSGLQLEDWSRDALFRAMQVWEEYATAAVNHILNHAARCHLSRIASAMIGLPISNSFSARLRRSSCGRPQSPLATASISA